MRRMKVLAAAALLAASPGMAEAQLFNGDSFTFNFDFAGNERKNIQASAGSAYGNNGGGLFGAKANLPNVAPGGPYGNAPFQQYLMWCIDPSRGILPPAQTSFQIFTLKQFSDLALGADPTPSNPAFQPRIGANTPNIGDLRAIASHVSAYETAFLTNPAANLNTTANRARQLNVWDLFRGVETPGGTAGNREFATANEWLIAYNDQHQTYMFRNPGFAIVPEPSSLALLSFGAAGLALTVRRRKINS